MQRFFSLFELLFTFRNSFILSQTKGDREHRINKGQHNLLDYFWKKNRHNHSYSTDNSLLKLIIKCSSSIETIFITFFNFIAKHQKSFIIDRQRFCWIRSALKWNHNWSFHRHGQASLKTMPGIMKNFFFFPMIKFVSFNWFDKSSDRMFYL